MNSTSNDNWMRAVVVPRPGGAEVLELGTCERPEPREGELLVRVHAAGVNRPDILQREGKYPPPPGASPLLGLEIAGDVAAMGPGCEGWSIGDRVFGLLPGGGYAEYAVIHHQMAMPLSTGLSFVEGAALPEVFLTAYQTLHWLAGMTSGEHVLIHAGASGVGTAAIQLVRIGGAHPYVTASASKLDACLRLGAELAVDYRTEDFAASVREASGGHGADIIVDFIGAPYLARNLEVLALDGRIVILATMGGVRLEQFDLRPLFRKRGRIIASLLRSRALSYQISLTRDFASYALPLFESGQLRPVIDRVYDWEDVASAHRRMEANENVGKIVLRVRQ